MSRPLFSAILLTLMVLPVLSGASDFDTSIRLATAKNACLEGRTGNSKDTDRLTAELEKWARYRIADRPFCDITIGIQAAGGNQVPDARKLRLDDSRDYLILTIWDYERGTMIYRDVSEWSFPGNPVRSAIKKLRSHVEAQQQRMLASESKATR